MTLRQIIDRACLTAAAGFVLFVCGYIITGNFSGQSYSSGTYCSGCAPKWSK